jgi:hypothetical protein
VIRASLLVVAALALATAGCGGGGKPPSVASLPPSHAATAATTTQSAPSEAGPGPSSSGQHFSVAMKLPPGADGEKFSACMRSHGVTNFPDPNGQGVIQLGSGSGVDPSSPKFQSAQQACRKLLPNGGQPTPAQIAKAQQQALKYSACMRSHGVKDFPDPTFHGSGIQLRVGGSPGSDLNPTSPIFQNAQTACQGILPGKAGFGGPGGK